MTRRIKDILRGMFIQQNIDYKNMYGNRHDLPPFCENCGANSTMQTGKNPLGKIATVCSNECSDELSEIL